MRALFTAVFALAAAVAFTFLLLPLVAIFLRVPVGHLFAQLGDPVTRDALLVSLKTSATVSGPTSSASSRSKARSGSERSR